LFEHLQDLWQRALPEPGDSQPEAWQHLRAVDPILDGTEPVAAIRAEPVELGLLAQRIDQPILAHAGRLVLDELLAAVAPDALGRDDLHNQVGRTIEKRRLNNLSTLPGNKKKIWLAPTRADIRSHNKWCNTDPAKLIGFIEEAQNGDQE